MDDSPFDASKLVERAEQLRVDAVQCFRDEATRQLDEIRVNPGAGPYAGDGPALAPQGAVPFPPGFVGALAQFIYQQAPLPVAEVAIVGALGLMAGIAGRSWNIPGSGLNLYIVLVARSAIGKEAMFSGISKVIVQVIEQVPEASSHVDFSDYVSGPALIKACADNPCFVNVAGEIGHKFLAMSKGNDPAMRSYQKQLTVLYSKSAFDSVAGGIAYSNQENNVASVQGIAFSLIGETTPGTFYQSITDAMMRDGLMSRFCVIEYTGDRPARNSAPLQRAPDYLVDHMVRVFRQAVLLGRAGKVSQVGFTQEAHALLQGYDAECHSAIIASGDDESQRAVWNRAHLNALRVAALLAVGDNPFVPMVTEEQAAYAVNLVRHGASAFLRRIRSGDVGEGSDGGREQKVMDLSREFLTSPPDKMPSWLKDGERMRQNSIVPRRYLQQRTQRLSAFENHKNGHKAALDMATKTAVLNGKLMEVKKESLVEQFGFHGQAYRVLSLN